MRDRRGIKSKIKTFSFIFIPVRKNYPSLDPQTRQSPRGSPFSDQIDNPRRFRVGGCSFTSFICDYFFWDRYRLPNLRFSKRIFLFFLYVLYCFLRVRYAFVSQGNFLLYSHPYGETFPRFRIFKWDNLHGNPHLGYI
jgi:hypothetical protein